MRETRITLGAFAFAFVEIMADGAHQTIVVPRNAMQRATEQFIRLSVAVNVRRHECADAAFVRQADHRHVSVFRQRFAKMHKAPAAPRPIGCARHVHTKTRSFGVPAGVAPGKFAGRRAKADSLAAAAPDPDGPFGPGTNRRYYRR